MDAGLGEAHDAAHRIERFLRRLADLHQLAAQRVIAGQRQRILTDQRDAAEPAADVVVQIL